jgi:hypothetical protein
MRTDPHKKFGKLNMEEPVQTKIIRLPNTFLGISNAVFEMM